MDKELKPADTVASKTAVKKIKHERLRSFDLTSEDGDVLSLRVRDGRPRFTIDYKIPEGKDIDSIDYIYRQMTAPFNFLELNSFIATAHLVVANKMSAFSVDCLYNIDKNGTRTKDKIIKANFMIRKNTEKEGNVFQFVMKDHYIDKETIFNLQPDIWYKFRVNNQPVPNEMFSEVFTKEYLENIKKVLLVVAKENKSEYATTAITKYISK